MKKNTLKLSWADETTEPKGRCVGTTWLDDEALKNQNTEPDLRELLFPDLMTSSPCPRVTAHETLTDLFPQLLVLFDSDVFFSSGLLHCIMGTVVSHQVSTTVALSSIKLSVTTVTDTQVSEGEKKQHHICISSDVRVVGVKVCGVRFSLRLVTTGKGRAGPLKSSWMVRKTKYEHGEQMRPLGGHLRRRRRRRKRRFRFYTSV